jgi:hypothetical protein
MFRSYNGETSVAQVPHHIIVDGVTIFVPDTNARRMRVAGWCVHGDRQLDAQELRHEER